MGLGRKDGNQIEVSCLFVFPTHRGMPCQGRGTASSGLAVSTPHFYRPALLPQYIEDISEASLVLSPRLATWYLYRDISTRPAAQPVSGLYYIVS